MAGTAALVALVAGQSQAMRAAWIEDLLSLLPPIAFLVALRQIRRPPDRHHPYGHHRSIGVAHLVAAVALLAMGTFLTVDSALTLIRVERPPVGLTVVFGHAVWSGWLMIAVMLVTSIGPLILGRANWPVAEKLHDKVLRADADMGKADWTTAVATILGVLGIGIGLWWADSVAAIAVAISVLRDGAQNLGSAVAGVTDAEARTFDDMSSMWTSSWSPPRATSLPSKSSVRHAKHSCSLLSRRFSYNRRTPAGRSSMSALSCLISGFCATYRPRSSRISTRNSAVPANSPRRRSSCPPASCSHARSWSAAVAPVASSGRTMTLKETGITAPAPAQPSSTTSLCSRIQRFTTKAMTLAFRCRPIRAANCPTGPRPRTTKVHIQHSPQAMVNGTTTRSPTASSDSAPASTTSPMGSCPMMSPGSMNAPKIS